MVNGIIKLSQNVQVNYGQALRAIDVSNQTGLEPGYVRVTTLMKYQDNTA